eukprot:gene17919-5645_t
MGSVQPTLEEFRHSLWTQIGSDSQLNNGVFDGCAFIAGGSVLAALDSTNSMRTIAGGPNASWKSDIDIFLYGLDDGDMSRKAAHLLGMWDDSPLCVIRTKHAVTSYANAHHISWSHNHAPSMQ